MISNSTILASFYISNIFQQCYNEVKYHVIQPQIAKINDFNHGGCNSRLLCFFVLYAVIFTNGAFNNVFPTTREVEKSRGRQFQTNSTPFALGVNISWKDSLKKAKIGLFQILIFCKKSWIQTVNVISLLPNSPNFLHL